MISLPDGFDAAQLFTDLFALAAPFVAISFTIACGYLIINMLRTIEF